MNANRLSKWLRLLVLVGLLLFVTYESYMHQVLGGGKAPSVHALCPYGALESLYALLFTGGLIQKIYTGTLVLAVLTIVLALLFRRSFCGLLCPFGALQELFSMIGRKIFSRRLTVPAQIDRPLRYLKYLILPLTVGMAWVYGELWMAPYDPYSAYSHLSSFSDAVQEDPLAIIGFALLAVTLAGSFLYDRFFCKYLCPVGAFYGLVGKLSPTRIVRNEASCVHCKACSRACPVNINVHQADKVTDMECINCNECVTACPKKKTLEIRTGAKALHPIVILLMTAGLFFGTVWVAQATNSFETIPSPLKEGQIIPVSSVKGYYTIEETATAIGWSLMEVYEKMGIPTSVSKNTKMKDISKTVPGFSFDGAKSKAE